MALTSKLQKIRNKDHRKVDLSDLLYGFRTIQKHLKRGTEGYTRQHAIDHLRIALQGAVTLEFATLPPYLSAIWSIKDELDPVAKSIREIVQEEMLHMALACNMLVAIGGRPKINTAVPAYPGKLPLNVHPELTVHLSGLTKNALRTFMEIERPHHPGHLLSLQPEEESASDGNGAEEDNDLTIGEFYDEILAAFRAYKPKLSTNRQVTGPLAWMVVTNLKEVEKAINTIKDQGEGSEGPPAHPDNLPHYWRFAEVFEGKKLVYDEAAKEYKFTSRSSFNLEKNVWPMATVPEGGYMDELVDDPEARGLLRSFNLTYSKLIDLLEAVWETDGGQASLWHAIDTMFDLEKYAKPLMQIPRADGEGNYGPDFRYIPQKLR